MLSVVGCLLALANVAFAATSSGEDQYLEQAPRGGGSEQRDEESGAALPAVDANGDGTVSEEEVKKAARKNKKSVKRDGSEEGPSGASGAVAGSGTTPTPPAAESVATSAKFGPVSRSTALIIAGLALVGGLGFAVFGGGAGSILGGDGSAASAGSNPGQGPR
ncbi:MAG: hypothetical protein HYX29_02095 [Solirubrobacterales bacterium]|nr:hypothetical protein [Solirubrobacterales bacterium]